ncbi:MAG: glycerate kinase [Azospirillaceae bacterium]
MPDAPAAALLRSLFDAALAAVTAEGCVPGALPAPPRGRTIVVGAGKAAAAMARAVDAHWPGPLEGLVITRDGHGVDAGRIEVVEASHPVPDTRGQRAAARILDMVRDLGPDDLVLCLISGGGSSLLAVPGGDLTLEDKQAVNKALLRSGAAIDEMNAVRKHLSGIKAGRLAVAAHPAQLVTLVISDVPGDDPSIIASGPTVPDPTTAADARAILERHGIDAGAAVTAHLASAAAETPPPDHPVFATARLQVIATPLDALGAAAETARAAGLDVLVLGDRIEGEAREVGRAMAGIALSCKDKGVPLCPPAVILSGGETTVTVRGNGRGGRNVEFLLGLAIALDGAAGISAIACDTDGIDGSEDNAGAIVLPDTLARARARGLDPRRFLADNDAYGFFAALGDLVTTGPTLTNVNDFRAIVVQ